MRDVSLRAGAEGVGSEGDVFIQSLALTATDWSVDGGLGGLVFSRVPTLFGASIPLGS